MLGIKVTFLGTYTTLIAELGIENVITKYFDKTDKSGQKLFYQTHLTLATKMKNEDLINSFCNSLLSKDSQWSHRDAFDILHYINPNTSTFSKTCLNYANENNDQKAGYKLLKVEDYAHNKSAYQVFSCIQQNLNMEALVPWLKRTYVDNIRKGLIPVTDYNDDMIKRKNRQALIAIIVEIGLISVLPFLIDFTSDLELLGDYKHISHIADNETNVWECGLDTNISFHQIPFKETKDNFAFAAKVTIAMVAMNVIVYMFGAKIASPEWLDVWKKGWDETNLQYEFVRSQNMDWYGKKLGDYPIFKQKYFWIKIFYKVMLGISYLLWPFLILMPNKYAYQISENPNERREGDARSSTAWRFVKIAEIGVENILQLVLQIWLIMPAMVLVSQWSWNTIASHTWQGVLNILSFGIYDACLLDKTLGKLVFTAITCSIGLSLFKVDRPGIGALYKIKAAPVIFLHLLIQIIARLYALKYLILLEINQYGKYLTALLVHIAILIPIKVITETQKLPRSLGLLTLLQRLALLLISCISSSIIMIDWHWNSSHLQAPKFMFFSRLNLSLLQLR